MQEEQECEWYSIVYLEMFVVSVEPVAGKYFFVNEDSCDDENGDDDDLAEVDEIDLLEADLVFELEEDEEDVDEEEDEWREIFHGCLYMNSLIFFFASSLFLWCSLRKLLIVSMVIFLSSPVSILPLLYSS